MSAKRHDDCNIGSIRNKRSVRPALSAFAALFMLTTGATLASPPGLCSDAEILTLNSTLRNREGDRACYRVEIPHPGILTLDASAPSSPEAEPRLLFLGNDSELGLVETSTLVSATPRGVVVVVGEAAAFFMIVAPEDPAMPLVSYKVRAAFTTPEPVKDVDEEDEDGSEIEVRLTQSPSRQDPLLSALCGTEQSPMQGDDHGDTPLCATGLEVGASVSGAIDNALGDDEDFFTFTVDSLRSIRIATTAAHFTLYDRGGLRLASSLGVGEAQRLVRVLPQGRYFLRVQNFWGQSDRYVLGLRSLEAAPRFPVARDLNGETDVISHDESSGPRAVLEPMWN